jgi:hypothetical protein
MIPLYTYEEFESANSRHKLPLLCEYCSKQFYRKKNDIQSALKNPSSTRGCFCSVTCGHRYKKKGHKTKVKCEHCFALFNKDISRIHKTKHNFCSKTCAAKFNNAHKTTGTRRSKLEVWLEQELTLLYPLLEFHFNKKDAINSELDIYIPSLHLAFELNGIFHYEPIYGQEKLDSIQNNDHRKFAACAEAGVSLCIIDVSSMKYFKPNNGKKYLTIITTTITQALAAK